MEADAYRRVLVNVGDDTGTEQRIARGLRDTGCEVIYTETTDPAAVAIDAVQEDVATLVTPYTGDDDLQQLNEQLDAYDRDDLELVLTGDTDTGLDADYMTDDITDAIKYVSRSYSWQDLDRIGDALAELFEETGIDPVDADAAAIEGILADSYSEGQAAHWTEEIVDSNSALFDGDTL